MYDVLVVGGGIVGAGLARDAVMRGLKTCLIDQQDFSGGTSSRSSRLLHGGIRYLAQANIRLVREASHEKMILHRIAPHLAMPLAFIFPAHRNSGWALWKLAVGVKVYDLLCGGKNLGRSTVLNPTQTVELLPQVRSEGLLGAVRYFDGLTNDSRLTLDTLVSAEYHGAIIKNYVRYVGAERRSDVWNCRLYLKDTREELELRARCVINATGPWSNNIPLSKTNLRLTKGVHLVVNRERVPIPDAVVFAERERILFAIPWGERVILGTTDTDYDGPVDSPTCDADDTRYILDVINRGFPSANLSEGDILATWAGLRPLVADKHGRPSDISRRHDIAMSHPGWWDVAGGKLTSYRLMAEETIDRVVRFLAMKASACRTDKEPLLSPGLPSVSGILPPPVCQQVVEHFCSREWAVHLSDVMIRRSSWRYYHTNHYEIANQVAVWMGNSLGWPNERTSEELRNYHACVSAQNAPVPRFLLRQTASQTLGRTQID